jgi:hypothetical protein
MDVHLPTYVIIFCHVLTGACVAAFVRLQSPENAIWIPPLNTHTSPAWGGHALIDNLMQQDTPFENCRPIKAYIDRKFSYHTCDLFDCLRQDFIRVKGRHIHLDCPEEAVGFWSEDSDGMLDVNRAHRYTAAFEPPDSALYIFAFCLFGNGSKTTSMHIFSKHERYISSPMSSKPNEHPSIVIISLDALSRAAAHATLHVFLKTFQRLNNSKAYEFQNVVISGRNTPPNSNAFFCGNSSGPCLQSIVDVAQIRGYLTAYQYHYNSSMIYNFFRGSPNVTLATKINALVDTVRGPFCDKAGSVTRAILNDVVHGLRTWHKRPAFLFSALHESHHPDLRRVASLDATLSEFLLAIDHMMVHRRIILWFWSDHGMSYGFPVQTDVRAAQEHRNPFSMLVLSKIYSEDKAIDAVLGHNERMPITHYDAHKTIMSLLGRGDILNDAGAVDLMSQRVPEGRTCASMLVPAAYCPCYM